MSIRTGQLHSSPGEVLAAARSIIRAADLNGVGFIATTSDPQLARRYAALFGAEMIEDGHRFRATRPPGAGGQVTAVAESNERS